MEKETEKLGEIKFEPVNSPDSTETKENVSSNDNVPEKKKNPVTKTAKPVKEKSVKNSRNRRKKREIQASTLSRSILREVDENIQPSVEEKPKENEEKPVSEPVKRNIPKKDPSSHESFKKAAKWIGGIGLAFFFVMMFWQPKSVGQSNNSQPETPVSSNDGEVIFK